jgi:hypothetical protein
MVPPALLRWLALRLGQTGRFALPLLLLVSSFAWLKSFSHLCSSAYSGVAATRLYAVSIRG